MITPEYHVKVTKIKKGGFGPIGVDIFHKDKKIGVYERNLGNLYNTNQFFTLDGKDYLMYSPDYQETAVMSLPDCKKIASHNKGFCPVDFWVPQYVEHKYKNVPALKDKIYRRYEPHLEEFVKLDHFEIITPPTFAPWGFVAGCVWGDDSSYKVQYLDLSKLHEGKVIQEPKFGYTELPRNGSLRESIELGTEYSDWIQFEISTALHFRQKKDGNFGLFSHYHGNVDYVDPNTGEGIKD